MHQNKYINRIAIITIVFFIRITVAMIWHSLDNVTCLWIGDRLRLSSMRGVTTFTHLYYVKDDRYYSAPLGEPIVFLESHTQDINMETLKKLHWQDRDGNVGPPPVVHTPVYAVFHRSWLSEYSVSPYTSDADSGSGTKATSGSAGR